MFLGAQHPFGINVGPSIKLGRGSTTIQTYSLTVPSSRSVNPEHYKFTKWRLFTVVSEVEEAEEKKKKDLAAAVENNESKFKFGKDKKKNSHEVQPVEAKEASPLDILASSKLDAWKINDAELDFESGFFVSSGSFGDVKTAKFRGTLVAVKMIKSSGSRMDAEEVTRFKHELLLCRDLRHPNIMQVLGGCWESMDRVYLVMEFCEKGSLGQLLKREGPQHKVVTTKLTWIIEMAKAMCYLHGFTPSIVHRDLKGDNVLVNKGMSVKLCDFGESRKKTNEGTMTTVGSPFWIAPEVFMGERYDESCDVYSFALCMVEVLFDSKMESVFNWGVKETEKK
jgi:serine/threonine protein kinase